MPDDDIPLADPPPADVLAQEGQTSAAATPAASPPATPEAPVLDLGIVGLTDPAEIGVGGFATVYKADQPAFRRTVAVKVIAALNLDDAAKERFERECQAMGSLSEHPNIVSVYDAGFTNTGRPYMIMAHLPGGSLQDRIDDKGTVSWQDATLIGIHLAGALETAHRAEVIHRDIKPANVLMSAYGDAQLTDFGIARISGGHETRSGVITASMAHAPPEVLDGQRPAIGSDVYSLGSTIFELMFGTPAFQEDGDESMVPMLRRILTAAPPDLRAHGVPDEVCAVIEKSMAKDPGDRQESALQFGRQLQAARRAAGLDPGKLTVPSELNLDDESLDDLTFVAAEVGDSAPTGRQIFKGRTVQVQAPAAPRPGTAHYVAPVPEPKKGRGALIGVGIVLVLLMIGVGVFAATRPKPEVAGPTTTEAPNDTQAPPSYNDDLERKFLGTCERRDSTSQQYCKCVFDAAKAEIPIRQFLEFSRDAERPAQFDIEKTGLKPILVRCQDEVKKKLESTGGTEPPALPPGTPS